MDPLAVQLARVFAARRGDPDELVPETGYANARMIPRWHHEYEHAERHVIAQRAHAAAPRPLDTSNTTALKPGEAITLDSKEQDAAHKRLEWAMDAASRALATEDTAFLCTTPTEIIARIRAYLAYLGDAPLDSLRADALSWALLHSNADAEQAVARAEEYYAFFAETLG